MAAKKQSTSAPAAPTIAYEAPTNGAVAIDPEVVFAGMQQDMGALMGKVHILSARLAATEQALQAERQKVFALIAAKPAEDV